MKVIDNQLKSATYNSYRNNMVKVVVLKIKITHQELTRIAGAHNIVLIIVFHAINFFTVLVKGKKNLTTLRNSQKRILCQYDKNRTKIALNFLQLC